jgi:ABC-type transport system involved in multi-copper enzyme maturation permease subunit
MTATGIRPGAPGPWAAAAFTAPSRVVRGRALLASEWTKFWSVRSTYWTLLVMVLTPVVFGALLAFVFAQPAKSAGPPNDPLLSGFLSLEYAVLAACVLGVLQFSSEYSTGLIRTTFTSVPRRRAVLAAKAGVLGGITLVAGEVVANVSFFLDQAILNSHHQGVSWSTHGAAGAVVANGAVLFSCVMLALAIGAIIRHTAGGISATIALIVLPAILGLLPQPWGHRISRLTLTNAAQQTSVLHSRTDQFSPTFSMVVLFAWPVIAMIVATVMITRSDT